MLNGVFKITLKRLFENEIFYYFYQSLQFVEKFLKMLIEILGTTPLF